MNSWIIIAWQIATGMWAVLGEMSPYLLFGFLMAGVLSVWIRPEFVETHLGRRGLRQVVKATLIGVPMPLCSCGVIPVAASLRRHGAGKGATAAFLASTPQTGVDSILATYGLLGGLFALFRIAVAFISGILTGFFVDRLDPDTPPPAHEPASCGCCAPRRVNRLRRIFEYGFLDLPGEIGGALLIGVAVAGLLGALVPPSFLAAHVGGSFWAKPMILALAIPLYVCSTGSIPIAFALMRAGVSPGTALVFLIAGPATNAATVTTLWRILGRRSTLIYLAAIILCSLAAGTLFDLIPQAERLAEDVLCHQPAGSKAQHLGAALLVAVLLVSMWRRRTTATASKESASDSN